MSLHDTCDGILDTQITWEKFEKQLRSALKTEAKFGSAKTVVDIGEGNGFASLCGLVTCDWTGADSNEKLPATVVIKIPSALPFRQLNDAMPEGQRMLEGNDALWDSMEDKLREVHNIELASYKFFDEFEGLTMPKMYYGVKFTPEDNLAGHMCMQHVFNSRVMNFHEEHTVEQMSQIARALGKIQACSLKKEPAALELHVDVMADYAKTVPLEAYCGVYQGLLAVDSSERTAELMKKINEILPKYYASSLALTIHKQMGFAPVLVNGDLRTENVLIDKDTGDLAALIDWQCTHLGVGVEDLMRIMLFALPSKERRDSSPMLVEKMYNSLIENLDGVERPYSLDTLQSVFDILFPHCALYFAAGSIMLMTKQEHDPSLSVEEKEKRKAVQLDKVLAALEDTLVYHANNVDAVANLQFRHV